MAAEMALPLPGKLPRKPSRTELGDRIFVVSGKWLLLLLISPTPYGEQVDNWLLQLCTQTPGCDVLVVERWQGV